MLAEDFGAEVLVILGERAIDSAVVDDGFETVEFGPGDVGMFVDGDSGEVLAGGRMHEPGFTGVEEESFFEDDRSSYVDE